MALYYEESGNGFPLILLHGNGEDHTYFENQVSFFSDRYRVIALDTRGHGKSPRGGGEFTLSRFADDLYEFMKLMGIEKAHILGFSDGANIAMIFALRHPEMIEKLILNGGNLSPAGIRKSVQLPIEVGYRITGFFAGKSMPAAQNAEMLGLMVNEPHIEPGELTAITVPTLVIAGTRDMVKRRHTELIAASLPDSRLVFIKGNHFIANRKAALFNEAVREFLGQR